MIFSQNDYPLTSLNTFGIKAEARHYVKTDNASDLARVVGESENFVMLGGGSNIIFTGRSEATIIQYVASKIELQGELVVVDAGVEWDSLVAWCTDRNINGLENLSLIPGTVGASPVQNIGAYGIEAGDRIEWVEYLDPKTGAVDKIAGRDCRFGYRESIFKHEKRGSVVLRVAYGLGRGDFRLDYGDLRAEVEKLGGATADNIRAAVIKIRREKLPDPRVLGNAGSFFKNPVINLFDFEQLKKQHPDIPSYAAEGGIKVPAGWLIDRAGWKGRRQGAVGVHEKQALVLVNYGGATADDVLNFAAQIEASIAEKYGIALEKEVTVI